MMVYTAQYKGYIITLGSHAVHVGLPKEFGGGTFLYLDKQKLLANKKKGDCIVRLEDIYKAIDDKIDELAKQKIQKAIDQNKEAYVSALYIGEADIVGFVPGHVYSLKVWASKHPNFNYVASDESSSRRCCPYQSLSAMLRNWTILP